MKAIKITIENKTLIELALKAVNGKSAAHAYTQYDEIAGLAKHAENILSALLPKKDFSGAMWKKTSGAKVANCYKGSRNGTRVTIERKSSAWYLISISPATLFNDGGGSGHLFLTAKQDIAAKVKLSTNYSIIKEVLKCNH